MNHDRESVDRADAAERATKGSQTEQTSTSRKD